MIAIIGDLHGNTEPVEELSDEVNTIIFVGDLGKADLARKQFFEDTEQEEETESSKRKSSEVRAAYMEIYDSTIRVLEVATEKASEVYLVYGNIEPGRKKRDKLIEEYNLELPSLDTYLQAKNISHIQNEIVRIGDVTVGGIDFYTEPSWVKQFQPDNADKLRQAKKDTEEIQEALRNWSVVPDIIISHIPPYGVCDVVGEPAPENWRGKHAGSKLLRDYIESSAVDKVFCGHIHEAHGEKRVAGTSITNLGLYRVALLP